MARLPTEEQPATDFLIRKKITHLTSEGVQPVAPEEQRKLLKRGRREGSLGILNLPARKTNALWRVERLDQNKQQNCKDHYLCSQ